MFLSVCQFVNGQTKTDLLDRIDFNDTTLVGSERLMSDILYYIGTCQDTTESAQNQIYDVILAVDNVLARCTALPMYRYVYQNLISGFSALGVNALVDYMVHLPYLEFVATDTSGAEEMRKMAESYSRVRIGSKAPDIQTVAADGTPFELYGIDADYTVLLFWSANCPHCREMIKEFGKYLPDKKDVTLVSVCVIGKKNTARKIIRKAKIANSVLISDGLGWNSRIVDDYAVDMTPSVFVLDKGKTILSKPFDVDEVMEIIK